MDCAPIMARWIAWRRRSRSSCTAGSPVTPSVIVRIAPVAAGRRSGDFAQQGEQFLSVAVAFAPDVTALGTLEQQF